MREPRERTRQADRRGKTSPSAEKPVIIHGAVPPRETLLEFIADNPDRASKREIAKAFGLKGEARVELKDLLRTLEDEGLLTKSRKSLARPGKSPAQPGKSPSCAG